MFIKYPQMQIEYVDKTLPCRGRRSDRCHCRACAWRKRNRECFRVNREVPQSGVLISLSCSMCQMSDFVVDIDTPMNNGPHANTRAPIAHEAAITTTGDPRLMRSPAPTSSIPSAPCATASSLQVVFGGSCQMSNHASDKNSRMKNVMFIQDSDHKQERVTMNTNSCSTVDFANMAVAANRSAKKAQRDGDIQETRRQYAIKDAALSLLIITLDEVEVDLSWQETAPNFTKLLISFPHSSGRRYQHAILDYLTGAARREVLARIGRPSIPAQSIRVERHTVVAA